MLAKEKPVLHSAAPGGAQVVILAKAQPESSIASSLLAVTGLGIPVRLSRRIGGSVLGTRYPIRVAKRFFKELVPSRHNFPAPEIFSLCPGWGTTGGEEGSARFQKSETG